MSLRERLTGIKSNGGSRTAAPPPPTRPAAAEPVPFGEYAPPPRPKERASGMYTGGRGREQPTLSPVEQLKVDLHRRLIERLDLEALEQVKDEAELSRQIRAAVVEFLRAEQTPLSQNEREEVVEHIVYEFIGLGPIELLYLDPTISDILVNGAREIYIERYGKLVRVPASFRNDAHLLSVIDRIVSKVGRRVDESSPMVDARLPDGSRVNAIIPPLALDGPVLLIRRFEADLAVQQLIQNEIGRASCRE